MDIAGRELLLARVVSGSIRLPAPNGRVWLVRPPTRDQRYEATQVYADVLSEAQLDGLYSDAELLEFLLDEGLWDEEQQKFFDGLPKEIDEFKVQLFKAAFKTNERKAVRSALDTAKAKLEVVSAARNAFNYLSAGGAASVAKARYLLGVTLHTQAGRRVFADDKFWERDSSLLEAALAAQARARVDDLDWRALAHNEPWRSTWGAHKAEGTLFGTSPVDYTDEQRTLVGWSGLYDSVYAHPECPTDEVIADDDLMDGWLIDQRRQRDQRLNNREGESQLGNEKIRGSQEVFVPADTLEDAKKVVNLNDEMGKATQKSRFATLAKKGEVNELEMPDTRRRLRMEFVQRMSESAKGG